MNPVEQRLALKAAAQWHARRCAAPDCAKTREQWLGWLNDAPVNDWAWQQLEQLRTQLQELPGPLARHTLAAGALAPARRTLLKGLVMGFGVAGLGFAGYRQAPVLLADVRTATGERRTLTLDDGTRLVLNTGSAVDVRYSAGQRQIVLLEGEIFIATAADPRPLQVRTEHGTLQPLGTRFNVRLYPAHTELMVVEHAVAVRNAATVNAVRVEAGMALVFDRGPIAEPHAADMARTEWNEGRLVFDDWRLDRVLAEIQRYRSGVVRCSDAIAGVRVSGVYPLGDTDRILAAIAKALQVQIETRTRYWVTLTAAR